MKIFGAEIDFYTKTAGKDCDFTAKKFPTEL